jgi:endonuclease/exonuclease/phosphatase family metal-dependent hydrolase
MYPRSTAHGRKSPRTRGHLRRSLTTALAILTIGIVMISSTGFTYADAASGPPRTVRVMSFNIHHAQGTDDVLDLARVADVINAHRPSIVGLQEVDRHWSARSDFVDQATALAEMTRTHVAFGANLDLDPPAPGQPRRQFGTAILSRHPIVSWENTLLPRFGDHEQRGLLRAEVVVRGVRLQVFNTHLQHNDAAERMAQVAAILEIMDARPEPAAPAVLVGDLNAVPEAPEVVRLTEPLRDTWTGPGGFTHPSEQPTHRIDYVLTTPDVTTLDVVVGSDRAVASDHLPVIATLRVRPPGGDVDA